MSEQKKTVKKKPAAAPAKKHKTKKNDKSTMILIVGLVLIAIPCAILGWILISASMDTGKPILGICRGEQILNVALGGTLIQDIPSQRPEAAGENHRDNAHRYAPDHPARVLPGTLLRSLMGCDELLTNSVHHQAVDTPAPGMRVCALSPAGIVEGIEAADGRFLLGLQWHPEAVAAVEERMQRPFTALVKASGEKKRHH